MIERLSAQVAAYCLSTLGSGTMFVRWWRLEEADRRRVWLLYGWFCGLMCVGSVFGAVAWAVWMQFLLAFFSCHHSRLYSGANAIAACAAVQLASRIFHPVRDRVRVLERCEADGA